MSGLSKDDVETYRRQGYFAPVDAFSLTEADQMRRRLEAFEATLPERPIDRMNRRKLHVRLPWIHDLVANPKILDAIENLIGSDILVYTSTVFVKEPGSAAITAWHQDGTCFGLSPSEHVSAWLALSDASELAGCMRFIPGSHKRGLLRHEFASDGNYLNYVGQYLPETFSNDQAQSAPLRAGQFSLHDTAAIHASEPNASCDRRIGLGISYIPAYVAHTGSRRMSATLVRGTDRFGHFDLEPDPRIISVDHAQASHELAYSRYRECWDEQMRQSMLKTQLN